MAGIQDLPFGHHINMLEGLLLSRYALLMFLPRTFHLCEQKEGNLMNSTN